MDENSDQQVEMADPAQGTATYDPVLTIPRGHNTTSDQAYEAAEKTIYLARFFFRMRWHLDGRLIEPSGL